MFKFYGMYAAIIGIVVSTVAAIIAHLILFKQHSDMLLTSSLLVISFGSASLIFENNDIFKMKPTVVYAIFALVALYDLMNNGRWIESAIAKHFSLPQNALKKVEIIWAFFFVTCAIANEIVWRNFDDNTWVNFKIFGLTTLNFTFVILTSLYIVHKQKRSSKHDAHINKQNTN